MATLTIRDVPDAEKEALRVRAAKQGRSMEAELRALIHEAVKDSLPADEDLYTAIRRQVALYGAVDLPPHPDEPVREPPHFE